MLHSLSNNNGIHDILENNFHFSLIDNINQNSRDNNHNHNNNNFSTIHSNDFSNLDKLKELNNNISDAIHIYNEELSKIIKINENMDHLNRKHNKMVNYLNEFKKSASEFQQFFEKHFKEGNTKSILNDIDNIDSQINKCKTNIDSYIENIYNENYMEYNESYYKVKELNNIFTLVKINSRVCPICLQKEATHFTIPCGHLYCKECSSKITISCYLCRQNILKVNPLYNN